jgi:hypothetical protein
VQCLVKLLEAAAANGQVELQISLITLAQALEHLRRQDDDVVSYMDLLQLGDALAKVQLLVHRRLEEEADTSRAFAVYRSDLVDSTSTRVAESCAALVAMCSPEVPDSIRSFGLWALGALAQAVNQQEPSSLHAQQLEAALGSTFATLLLQLPRSSDDAQLQLQAATVVWTDCSTSLAKTRRQCHGTHMNFGWSKFATGHGPNRLQRSSNP